jgi:uncharacterized protein YndB with AHSA1/START domain/uncharacterized glyoxalase superfamily protein PhnB
MRSEYKTSDFAGLERGKFYDAAKAPSTRMTRYVKAPRADVYRALLDPEAVAQWKVPAGMTCRVHAFDSREGGAFRISLTYDEPTGTGKTTAHTDTYHGRFVKLVPDEQVVEVMEFETDDAAMRGEMTVTYTLTDAGGGTDVVAVHDNVPPGVSPADNEAGWRQALDKLAALVEAAATPRLLGAAPQFTVPDLVRTAKYYRDVLGFEIAGYWGGEHVSHTPEAAPVFAIVFRDEAQIFFNRADRSDARTGSAQGAYDVYLTVTGIDALAAELRARGAEILDGPEDRVYGQRELMVRDCNGLVLAFGEATGRGAG